MREITSKAHQIFIRTSLKKNSLMCMAQEPTPFPSLPSPSPYHSRLIYPFCSRIEVGPLSLKPSVLLGGLGLCLNSSFALSRFGVCFATCNLHTIQFGGPPKNAGGTGATAAQAAVDRAELSPRRGRQRARRLPPPPPLRTCQSPRRPACQSACLGAVCVGRVLHHPLRTPPPPPSVSPPPRCVAMAPAAFLTPVAGAAATRSSASAFAAGARVSGRPTIAGGAPAVVAASGRGGRPARLAMKVTIEEAPLPNSMRGVTIHVSADEVALCYNKVCMVGGCW